MGFGRHIVYIIATTYQETSVAIVQFLHASDTSALVEIREAADAYVLSLLDGHSFYSHISLFKWVPILFPLVKLL